MQIASQQTGYRADPVSGEAPISSYPPSWVDHFFEWVRRLPLPAWLFYTGLWCVLYLLVSVAVWVEGAEPVGFLSYIAFDSALYILYYLALMHYLDSVAGRALDLFRPLLHVNELDYKQLRYELTTLPARNTLLAGSIGILVTVASLPFIPPAGKAAELAHNLSAQVAFAIGNAVMATFVYHTVRQLRMVTHIQATATRVNLYRREPVYAFSRLTARTGIGWILALTIGMVPRLGPTLTAEGGMSMASMLLPFALLLFILPLHSIHRLLAAEKRRLQCEVERRLEMIFAQLHGRMDAGDIVDVGGVKVLLDSLLVERDTLSKIPTWPWKPGTVAGFSSALLLPVIIWFCQQVLMDLLLGK
jgi:hypothetical protein